MKLLCVTVPPTKEQGSSTFIAYNNYYETLAQNALWKYNSMRKHDGLPPLKRMPKGTKYERLKCLVP
jgi:catechol-2,3-dioxygenase